jgi:hypothetical protein
VLSEINILHMKLSQIINQTFSTKTDEIVYFGDFLKRLSHKGFGLFISIIALISAVPIPVPGYSTPFGMLLLLLGLQVVIDRKFIWFPDWMSKKPLPDIGESKNFLRMIKVLKFFEKFIKPRLKLLSKGVFYRLAGVMIVLCSISMILPIPFGNTIPATGIFLFGLGMLEEDGLVILAGMIVSLIGLCVTSLVVYLVARFGIEGVNLLTDWLKSIV